MKTTKSHFLVLLSLLTLFGSCQINDGEMPKTTGELQIFDYCNVNTLSSLDMLDNVIGLSLYLSAPDSIKSITALKVLKGMSVVKTKPSTYKLVKYDKDYYRIDTLYTVVIDSNSIYKKGAKWQITKFGGYYSSNQTSTITCLDTNKWSFKTDKTQLCNWLTSGELIVTSSNQRPLFFSKVTITGANNLSTTDSLYNSYKVNYTITSPLFKDSLQWKISDGKFTGYGEYVDTKQNMTINGAYSFSNKIIYHNGITITNPNNNLDCYYRTYQTTNQLDY
jgi:hypothetical protein